jgi:pantoate--beta-alanine ligase
MLIVKTVAEVRAAVLKLRRQQGPDATLALVPTMGAIHEGHLSLIRAAKRTCNLVAASIFVNPLQFTSGEDFDKYPRLFEADSALLAAEGIDLLFVPTEQEMYPPSASTIVEVQGISDRLDGASRPGHFRGVATIVTKLLNIVTPDVAYFGQKDAAQIAILRAMVRDLNIPVQLVASPTVRDPDGLALSSRNRYLTTTERHQALTLHSAIQAAQSLVAHGEIRRDTLQAAMLKVFSTEPAIRVDYAEVVDPDTLESLQQITGTALIAVAAWVGTTRLIDNCIVNAVPNG